MIKTIDVMTLIADLYLLQFLYLCKINTGNKKQ